MTGNTTIKNYLIKVLPFVILCVCLTSCIRGYRGFTTNPVKQTSANISGLSLNGVFLASVPDTFHNDPGRTRSAFFLYDNGVASLLGPAVCLENTYYDSLYKNKPEVAYVQDMLNHKFKISPVLEYGGYQLNNKEITIQIFRYYPQFAWDLTIYRGAVVNDTTIYIASCSVPKNPDKNCLKDTYLRFIQMEKPDSTNRLMKRRWYWKR